MKEIVLFKSASEESNKPDKFETFLCVNMPESQVAKIPVLQFNFCNIELLREKLRRPESYGGIVLSSQRCVSALQLSQEQLDPSDWDKWTEKAIFCVGHSTANHVKDIIKGVEESNIFVGPSENSESLGQHILTKMLESPSSKHLLYPCGNLASDTLKMKTSSGGITLDEVVVYETVEHEALHNTATSIDVDEESPFVFFSPSGLNYSLPYIQDKIHGRPLIALGPTTKDALLKVNGVNPDNVFQLDTPSPQGLLQCIKTIQQKLVL